MAASLASTLVVHVHDLLGQPLAATRVALMQGRKLIAQASFDPRTGNHVFEPQEPGTHRLSVAAHGLQPQQRTVELSSGAHEETFVLGEKGLPHYYRGRTLVPFRARPELLAVVLRRPDELRAMHAELEGMGQPLHARLREVPANLRANGVFLYQLPEDGPERASLDLQATLSRHEGVLLAGPVLSLLPDNVSVLTNSVIARFKPHVREVEARALARRLKLEVVRSIPYAGNAFEMKAPGPVTLATLDLCDSLIKSALVEYAEPDLWHTVENDLITPSDWLHAEQWDHALIGMPSAWQSLADIAADRTFGAPDVILAVVDSGIDAAHPAFAGNVSSGVAKVHQLFDFTNMVANNNSLAGDHGTCCAGAATARADDPSPVAGVVEGTAGMAGNCRLIGIRSGGTEARFADMYVWAAGFDPNSTTPAFPAPISPGADVITNSFGFSIGAPISGLMRDTFDFLTTYGRGGKGVLLFFSAGNNGGAAFCTGADGTLLRPWGMYRKCHSIAASTLDAAGNEVKASYSNFGPQAQFCAPSGGNCTGRHNPPTTLGALTPTIRTQGNLPGHPADATTLALAAGVGGGSIRVASAAGVAVGEAVLIGNPGAAGSEGRQLGAVNAATGDLTLDNLQPGNIALFNAHPLGTPLAAAAANYRDNFGGTSYSTPVCAGLAVLMLSANPSLTWIEVRELIKATAVKIDPGNTDPVGCWRDTANRISTDPGYTGPWFSQWYGFGRIDAAAAMEAAADYPFDRDIVVRDNLADTGAAPSIGPFWESPDIWVRNANDGVVPANYATHANIVHQAPIAGQTNWVYVRLRNRGTADSYPCSVRVYLAHWSGPQFLYPADFQPSVRPSAPLPTPLVPGTYLIGEVAVPAIAAGTDTWLAVQWPAALVPPATVVVMGAPVHWHPCLLVEVTPHDGFTAPGPNVWHNNNLAQKNLSITYLDSVGDDFNLVAVVGNPRNRSRVIGIELLIRWPIPRSHDLRLRFDNRHVERYLLAGIKDQRIRDLVAQKAGRSWVFRVAANEQLRLALPNVGLLPVLISGSTRGWKKSSIARIELRQWDDGQQLAGGVSYEVHATRPGGRHR